MAQSKSKPRATVAAAAAITALGAVLACEPLTGMGPGPETPADPFAAAASASTATVSTPKRQMTGANAIEPARAIEPPPAPALAGIGARSLIAATSGDAPLALPTVVAAVHGGVVAFGRTRNSYVARFFDARVMHGKEIGYGAPIYVAPAFDDDAPVVAVGDEASVWFAVSDKSGFTTRIVRVEVPPAGTGAPLKALAIASSAEGSAIPGKLGRIVDIVPMKPHIALIGRDGSSITMARMNRTGNFPDAYAKVVATSPARSDLGAGLSTRSPQATLEDDRLLLAWDADNVDGALDFPGTTAADRVSPKSGIYVRRFNSMGDPASPARRLTRLSAETHVLDLVVELGACAVLASTSEGFEMFRFVRKGDDLGPYGGGLHLAGPGGDVSLATDVIGTLAVTPNKLLRIGPGVKIVGSPLGFTGPGGAPFEQIHVISDGNTAFAHLSTKSAAGTLPTIAHVDGESMGHVIPTPWSGPSPQRLVHAAMDGDEGLALVAEGGVLHAVRFGVDGEPKSTVTFAWDAAHFDELSWPKSSVPRAAVGNGEWALSLADGRVVVASGSKAGTVVAIGKPKEAPEHGAIALVSAPRHDGPVRAVYVPPVENEASLWTATIDPATGVVTSPWAKIEGTDHHYGALGGARFTALPRTGGGLFLLTSSGPKVTVSAQLYALVALDEHGTPLSSPLVAPYPLQEISLVPSTHGPVLAATLTGRGVAARWLDDDSSWRESFAFNAFRKLGDGPFIREKTTSFGLAGPGLPFDLGPTISPLLGERCPFVLRAGERQMLLGCEEGSGPEALSARAWIRRVTF
jgi:hypothetical protein